MKIALFSDCYTPVTNGVVAALSELRGALTARGHQTDLVVPDYRQSRGLPREEAGDPGILRVPGMRLPGPTGDRLAGLSRRQRRVIIAFLRRRSTEVIHLHTEASLARAAREAAEELELPLLYTAHTRWEEYRHYLPGGQLIPKGQAASLTPRLFRSACRGVIALTPAMAQRLAPLFPGLPLRIIPNATAPLPPPADGTPSAEDALSPEDGLQLLFAGRLGREKRILPLLGTLAPFLRENPRRNLVLLGDGPRLGRARRFSRRLGIAGQTVFPGRVPRQEMTRWYRRAHLFVSLSLSEVNPMTGLEALMEGLPLAVRQGGGFDSLLSEPSREGASPPGALLPSDADLLPQLKRWESQGTASWEALRDSCRRRGREAGNGEAQAAEHEAFYREVIDHFENRE